MAGVCETGHALLLEIRTVDGRTVMVPYTDHFIGEVDVAARRLEVRDPEVAAVTFTVLTLFPGLFAGFLGESILARSIERGLVAVRLVDIRDYAVDRHRVCDDAPYGGGPGMVMKPEPLAAALEAIGHRGPTGGVPDALGTAVRPATGRRAGRRDRTWCWCAGRYEGVDQRVIDAFVTDEVSVGDYVLSGGEVAAMAVIDSVARLVKGVIAEDSLDGGELLGGAAGVPALHAARGVPGHAGARGAAVGAPREHTPVAAGAERREDAGQSPRPCGLGRAPARGTGALAADGEVDGRSRTWMRYGRSRLSS